MAEREHLVQRIVRVFVVGPLSPLLLVVATLAGVVAVIATPREEEPQIVVPMADVMVSFPGASAEEVEQLVATPLEQLLWQLEGVEHVYSVARRDAAVVTVRFVVGEDRERALIRLQSRIEAHRDEAPPGVAGWIVRPVEIDDVPIVALTLWSLSADDARLRRVAEELAARLAPTPDLSRTAILGGRARQVRVELDPEALAAHGLSPLEVAAALRAADAALAAGAFDRGDRRVGVVVGPFVGTSREVGQLVVGTYEGRPVHLGDVARVVDGPEETQALVRLTLGPAGGPGSGAGGARLPAVTLAFAKKRGTNAVRVADEILARARAVAPAVLPSDVRMLVTRNYGATADHKVNELLGHLTLAIVTVTALIAFALGWREALIVAAAVPLTFALALLVNFLGGYTINRVTLFALVLVLGLVCDDPIVDVENIHRHLAAGVRRPLDAVLFAVNEVRPPVIVATLGVIVSFVPLFFITGMMGPYMRPMALNVPVAMAMSLVVAFTITPWMAFHMLQRGPEGMPAAPRGVPVPEGGVPAAGGDERAAPDAARGRLAGAYRRALAFFLGRRAARWAMLLAIVGLLAGAMALIAAGAIPLKMLPYDNKSELQVVLDLPEGSTLAATDAAVQDVERHLGSVAEVTDVAAYVGTASPIDFNGLVRRYGFRRAPHLADLRVNLVGKDARAQQSHAIALRLRRDLETIAAAHGATLTIVETPPGPPVLATLVAEVRGPAGATHDELVDAGRRLASWLAAEPGAVDVDVMAEAAHRRLDFVLDKEKAALHGVATVDVARTLRLALAGEGVATVHEPWERQPLRLVLRLDRASRAGATELSRVRIKSAGGTLVSLAELGAFDERAEDQPVYHKDLERIVFVLADVAGRPPVEIVLAMQARLAGAPFPHGIWVDWGGEGEWKITLDVFRDLGLAFAAALVGIYVLLVAETRSFTMPLIIMVAIPLGMIGIAPGFWILNLLTGDTVGGYPDPVWFTATGMIGMIALAGIVVRNSVILIDFIQTRRAAGARLTDAIVESGVRRFRPIVLTAGTTMLGAWPITLDPIFAGLAWSLIFGMLASVAFTLVVVPVAYYAMERSTA